MTNAIDYAIIVPYINLYVWFRMVTYAQNGNLRLEW